MTLERKSKPREVRQMLGASVTIDALARLKASAKRLKNLVDSQQLHRIGVGGKNYVQSLSK